MSVVRNYLGGWADDIYIIFVQIRMIDLDISTSMF
jgi:hypothetical protein